MKVLKWVVIIVAVLSLSYYFIGMPYLREQTKKHSPEITNTYTKDGYDLAVTFSSPFKKGRVIFGELVPYNRTWRTGANEPTTFSSATDIRVSGKDLPKGIYSLWTVPKADSWTVIFNEKVPDWGVTLSSKGQETSHEPDFDVIRTEVPVQNLSESEESFTIDFSEEAGQLYLNLYWDTTKVQVPINK